MNEYVKELTNSLEPLIEDLDEKLAVLDTKKRNYDDVSKFLSYVHDDVHLVSIYAEQDLILGNLSNINSNEEEYKASCYLLRGEDERIKALPQYGDAYHYIEKMIQYFKECKEKLGTEIEELESLCSEKKLDKKYFEIFSDENPFVTDVLEFESFLDKRVTDNEQKKNILIYTINSNILNYCGKKS